MISPFLVVSLVKTIAHTTLKKKTLSQGCGLFVKTSIFLLKRKASQISWLLFLISRLLLSFKYLPRFYTTSVTAFEEISSTIIHFNHDHDPYGSSFYTYHVWIKATYLPNWQHPLLKTTPPKVVYNSSPPLMVWRSSSL